MAASTVIAGHRPHKKRNHEEHISFNDGGVIDATLHEVLQEPYNDGIGAGRGALMRIDYRPYGFSVGRVLNGDFSDIPNPDEIVVGRGGAAWPEKLSIHLMFGDPAFEGTFRKQRRVKKDPAIRHSTKATFATFVAEGLREAVSESYDFSRFPYTVDEVRVASIDVRSRGTLQPRVFVDGFAVAQERLNSTLGRDLQELQELHGLSW